MSRLLIIGPFRPLYSYGGPTRSVSNLFDLLFSNNIYPTVLSPEKNLDGTFNKNIKEYKNNNIFYCNSVFEILKQSKKGDVLWLNSIFDSKTLIILFYSTLINCQVIISPRGELASEALTSSKPILKRFYLKVVEILGSKIIYHATSKDELKDLKFHFKSNYKLQLPNLVSLKYFPNSNFKKTFVFYSRIHKKKGLLEMLIFLKNSPLTIKLDIYGFIEDQEYWKDCVRIINELDGVEYRGSIKNGDFKTLRNEYTFFLFPTLNENFGHVIMEAISIGMIPIITKNATPFEELISKYFNLNFELNKESFYNSIVNAISLNVSQLTKLKANTKAMFDIFEIEQSDFEKKYVNFVKSQLSENE